MTTNAELRAWAKSLPAEERDLVLDLLERLRATIGEGHAEYIDADTHASRIAGEVLRYTGHGTDGSTMARRPAIGPPPQPGDKRKRVVLDELYAELPALDCQQLCAESCGPILMTRVEWQRVCRAVGEERHVTDLLKQCPILVNGLCGAYDVRPMLCRLFGVVESMPCPHGCIPERWLTKDEGYEFLARAAEVAS